MQSGLRPLSALAEASGDERVARVTVWEPGWLTPKSRPRVIMVARSAQGTSGAEVVFEWLPDVQEQARSAWIWLISVLLGANLLWAGYLVRLRPGAIALRQLAQATKL